MLRNDAWSRNKGKYDVRVVTKWESLLVDSKVLVHFNTHILPHITAHPMGMRGVIGCRDRTCALDVFWAYRWRWRRPPFLVPIMGIYENRCSTIKLPRRIVYRRVKKRRSTIQTCDEIRLRAQRHHVHAIYAHTSSASWAPPNIYCTFAYYGGCENIIHQKSRVVVQSKRGEDYRRLSIKLLLCAVKS